MRACPEFSSRGEEGTYSTFTNDESRESEALASTACLAPSKQHQAKLLPPYVHSVCLLSLAGRAAQWCFRVVTLGGGTLLSYHATWALKRQRDQETNCWTT